MKSLERLNKIEEFYQKLIIDLYLKLQISKWEKDAIYDKYKDDFEQIKADLEVLEILRKHLEIIEYLGMNGIETYGLTTLKNKEDFNKLKQWLEENE